MRSLSLQKKLKSLFFVSVGGIGAYATICIFKNDETFYKNVVMPLVHLLDPEQSHELGILISKHRLIPKSKYVDPNSLKITIFGKEFKNPIGIAAGFDKNAEAVLGLKDIGFGFIEVGSVTPEPQLGNDKPRVFRLPEDRAVINRYGFNSHGHHIVLERLSHIKTKDCNSVVGVNLGKNKTSPDPVNDYVVGIQRLGPVADYIVINVSSPNTPGLRSMQDKNVLKSLLQSAVKARDSLPDNCRPPLLLKLAPDLSFEEITDIAEVVVQKRTRIDGLIISNTTTERPQFLANKTVKDETGGLSGGPLRDSSTRMIADVYKLTKGKVPIIGVGGVFTGQDAYEKIKAGASVIQLYTSLVYEGPPIVTKIKKELAQLLEKDGYTNIQEAVGRNVR